MLKLTVESTSWGPNGRRYDVEEYADGRVFFGSYREPRGKVRSPPKLRRFDSRQPHESFAEVRVAGPGAYLMRVGAGDFDVFLNGRKVDAERELAVRDGDLLRIAKQRFIIGDVPTYPRDDVEAGFSPRSANDRTRTSFVSFTRIGSKSARTSRMPRCCGSSSRSARPATTNPC